MSANNQIPGPQVRQLFLAALDIADPAERERFLDQSCGPDQELRRQVKELLAGHKDDSFLEKPAMQPDPGSAVTVDSTTGGTVEPSGRIQVNQPTILRYFGDYELLEEIARGGMGVVWKGRQRSLNRIVAVKMIIGGQLATPADVRRFHTEAEAAANLKHPNIVAIHEIGEHEGRHYFSMDLIEGKNLAQVIADRPMAPQRAASLVKTLAEAVHYAHQRGTLHRDLKPQNVLIDGEERPHITDFGLAKQMSAGSDLTQNGTVMGSPSYMPPEQATGRLTEIGPASDVYSLGAMLYQTLTGKAPFVGATPVDTLRLVIEQEVVAPAKLNAAVPTDLETICLKCLAKKPEQRYATARALAEELERFLKHEPILAKPASISRKLISWCRQRPWVLTGGMALGFLALAGLTIGLWEHNRLLQWLAAHPGRKPGVPWSDSLRHTLIGMRLLLVPFVIVQYVGLWEKRLKRLPVSRQFLAASAVLGGLAVMAGITGALIDLSSNIWSRKGLSVELSISAGFSFSVCWPGVLLAWEALRGQDQFWFGGSTDDLNPAKQLNFDGVAWLLALPLWNAAFFLVSIPIISLGQFQPESAMLANGVYLASPADEVQYRESLRMIFALTAMWMVGLPTCFSLWRRSRPPWRDMGPIMAAIFICSAPAWRAQMPPLLFNIAITLGLFGGWLTLRLAPLRSVKDGLGTVFKELIHQWTYLLLLLLVMAVGIAMVFGLHQVIPSRMPGGTSLVMLVLVAHWPFAWVIWQTGQPRGRLLVIGTILYFSGVSYNTHHLNYLSLSLTILAGALLGGLFVRAMQRSASAK